MRPVYKTVFTRQAHQEFIVPCRELTWTILTLFIEATRTLGRENKTELDLEGVVAYGSHPSP
jgi:hypothetical protein